MEKREIQAFVDGMLNFFYLNLDKLDIDIGESYLTEPPKTPAYDFTGIIGISGQRRGCVYYSSQSGMLETVLEKMGEPDFDDELLGDLVGEIANTIAGNARSVYGSEFLLSVPVVVNGRPENIQLPKNMQAYVLPVKWEEYESCLIICID